MVYHQLSCTSVSKPILIQSEKACKERGFMGGSFYKERKGAYCIKCID